MKTRIEKMEEEIRKAETMEKVITKLMMQARKGAVRKVEIAQRMLRRVEAPFYKRIEAQTKKQESLKKAIKSIEEQAKRRRWAEAIPVTPADMELWYESMQEKHGLPSMWNVYPIHRVHEVNEKVRVLGVGNDNERPDRKVYVAFDVKTKKVIGHLFVEPSQHRGDSTFYRITLKGREVHRWDEEKSAPNVSGPLAIFIHILKNGLKKGRPMRFNPGRW